MKIGTALMLTPWLPMVSILGWGLAFCYGFRITSAVAVLTAHCLCILVLLVAGLAGLLEPAATTVLWSGVILALVVIALAAKSNRIQELLSPGLVFFIILAAIFTFQTVGLIVYENDGFSLWASGPKEMFHSGRLMEASSSVIIRDYPPALLVNSYFFLSSSDTYSEGAIYAANYVLTAAACSVLFARVIPSFSCLQQVKGRLAAVGLTIVIFVFIFVLNSSFYSVTSDLPTASILLIAIVLLMDERNPVSYFIIVPVIVVLTLTRPSMLLIVPLTIFIIYCSYWVRYRANFFSVRREARWLPSLFLVSFFTGAAWLVWVYLNDLKSTSSVRFFDIPMQLFYLALEHWPTLERFLQMVLSSVISDAPGNSGHATFSLTHWFLISTALGSLILVLGGKDARRHMLPHILVMAAIVFVWVLVHLLLYIAIFNLDTARGIDRYFGLIIGVAVVYYAYLALMSIRHMSLLKSAAMSGAVIALFGLGWLDWKPWLTPRNERMHSWILDRISNELGPVQAINLVLGQDDSIYLLQADQARNGEFGRHLSYILLPAFSNRRCQNLRFDPDEYLRLQKLQSQFVKSGGHCVFTDGNAFLHTIAHDHAQLTKRFGYVYALTTDDTLQKEVGPLVKDGVLKKQTLYRIVSMDDNRHALERVDLEQPASDP